MSTNIKPADDLDALRIVIDAVKDFKAEEQERIFRWAAEKLGLGQSTLPASAVQHGQAAHTPAIPSSPHVPGVPHPVQDIKSFVGTKNPRTDQQFAATVAYYFRFEAPTAERLDSIGGQELQEACRKVGRARLTNPTKTLSNAHQYGLLDKAGEAGRYSLNAVGENLVAMTLPGDGATKPPSPGKNGKKTALRKKAKATKAPAKKPAKKT
jgi:hypothetical protein